MKLLQERNRTPTIAAPRGLVPLSGFLHLLLLPIHTSPFHFAPDSARGFFFFHQESQRT